MAVLTIDASVFLNSVNRREEGYRDSNRFMRWVHSTGQPVVAPNLLLVEVAAAIARGQGKPDRAERFVKTLHRMGHMTFVSMDESVMWESIDAAAHHLLRGSDAVYVAVARRYQSTLVTLDAEQRQRVEGVVQVQSPAELLSAMDEEG